MSRLVSLEQQNLTAVRGRGWGLGEKSEGIKQRKKERLMDTDNNTMVITRGNGVREVGKGIGDRY